MGLFNLTLFRGTAYFDIQHMFYYQVCEESSVCVHSLRVSTILFAGYYHNATLSWFLFSLPWRHTQISNLLIRSITYSVVLISCDFKPLTWYGYHNMLTWPDLGTVNTWSSLFGALQRHIKLIWSHQGYFGSTTSQQNTTEHGSTKRARHVDQDIRKVQFGTGVHH